MVTLKRSELKEERESRRVRLIFNASLASRQVQYQLIRFTRTS